MREGMEASRREEMRREQVKKLEQLDIGKLQVAETILISLGMKPATEVDVYRWNDSPEEIKSKLEGAGLVAINKDLNDKNNGNLLARLVVARDQAIASELLKANADNDHDAYGRLMGFPETAIEAFDNENKLLPKDQYPDMEGVIFAFSLSKDNYEEEMKVLRDWTEAVKKYSPDTFQELSGTR